MNDRTFGVELEFNMQAAAAKNGAGINQHALATQTLLDAGIKWDDRAGWIGSDGSGIEIRTPILKGQAGMNQLKHAMDALLAAGGVVTNYDGMHVHHGAPEFVDNKELMVLATESWKNCRSLIGLFVNPNRNSSGACTNKWNDQTIQIIKDAEAAADSNTPQWDNYGRVNTKILRYACSGRGDLNLASLYEHGTIEFRLHEGTLDSDRAEAWVRFGQRFLTTILKRGTPLQAADANDLLRKLRCSKTATQRLLERASEMSQLNARQNKLIEAYNLA